MQGKLSFPHPKGKTKSVVLTDEGVRLAATMLQKHFEK